MSRAVALAGLAGALLVLAAAGGWYLRETARAPAAKPADGYAALAAQLRAVEERFPGDTDDRPLAFPADHAAHARSAAETWDFAGGLRDADGQAFGVRLNLGRLGLTPEPPRRASTWAAAAAYRGLFALADGGRGTFHSAERYERAALDLAGDDGAAGRLWLGDWSVELPRDGSGGFRLKAQDGGMAVDLRLVPAKAPVVPEGLGENGPLRGYALSRLDVSGTVMADGAPRAVTGTAWLGHTWGRLLPPGGQVALDRFQLQLGDGRELMILRLRRRDGSAAPVDRGLLIGADGRAEMLSSQDFRLETTDSWRSPASGARYPVRWTLRLPALGAELSLAPLVENQETGGTLRAWSGAVRVTGTAAGGKPLMGVGFVDASGD